jgi:hypothetical protein
MRQQTFEKKDGCLLRQQILVDQLLGLNRFNFLQFSHSESLLFVLAFLSIILVFSLVFNRNTTIYIRTAKLVLDQPFLSLLRSHLENTYYGQTTAEIRPKLALNCYDLS